MPAEQGWEGHRRRHDGEEFEFSNKNYYQILNVPPAAGEAEIKKAFRKLSIEHHPDRGGNLKTFQYISEAWNTLKDPQKRREYDLANWINTTPPRTDYPPPPRSDDANSPRNKNSAEHLSTDDSPDAEQKDAETEIYIIREGTGLFAREFLADPVTRKKLGSLGYDKILVRDDLVIGQSGGGLTAREYLLDAKTGRSVNIAGYDRIEKRNGKIIGIKKAGLFGSETIEEIKAS